MTAAAVVRLVVPVLSAAASADAQWWAAVRPHLDDLDPETAAALEAVPPSARRAALVAAVRAELGYVHERHRPSVADVLAEWGLEPSDLGELNPKAEGERD